MKSHEIETPALKPARGSAAETTTRFPFTPPRLERLGEWNVLTLQQSIPIGPGNW